MLSVAKRLLTGCTDRFSCDLALDLGSTNTLIFRKGKGIIIAEPSLVAFQGAGKTPARVLNVGAGAKELMGKEPGAVTLVKPVKHGAIADFGAAGAMLAGFFSRIRRKWFPASFRVIANVRAGATENEKTSLRKLLQTAGAREVYLFGRPHAVVLGSGLDMPDDKGVMVLDIGGGTTEMAVIAGREVISTRTIGVGGEQMDRAIVEYVKGKYGVIIDVRTAEMLKIRIGEADPSAGGRRQKVSGRRAKGKSRFADVSSADIALALSGPLHAITETAKAFLRDIPSDLYVDILDRGVILAGGGSLLRGVDRLLEQEIMMPILKAADPLACQVLGTAGALEYVKEYRSVRESEAASGRA